MSSAAHEEESAASASEKEGALGHVAATALGGSLLPDGPTLPSVRETAKIAWLVGDTRRFRSRTVAPLLDPPLS